MTEVFYAVKIEDLVSKEFWDIVPAKSRGEAFEIAANVWSKYGGRVGKIRLATAAEIQDYHDLRTMTREEYIRHEKY